MRKIGVLLLALALVMPGFAQVKIYDTVYQKVDPGPTFTEMPRTAEEWSPPPPTKAEKLAGFIPFTRPEPQDIKPWSKPRQEERVEKMEAIVTKGEATSLWCAIYALEPLRKFRISLSAPFPIEVRYVHFWAQRTDWRGRTYYITPELLLRMEGGFTSFPAEGGTLQKRPLDIPKGECRLFWFTLRIPENAKPQTYKALLKLQSEGKPALSLPLEIKVLPISLKKPPDKRWLLYSDSWLWGKLSDDKVLSILKEISSYGIDGLTELPFGELKVKSIEDIEYDPSPFLRFVRLMRKVGMKGPHTIGIWAESLCANALNLPVDLNKKWPEELKEGVRRVARKVVSTLRSCHVDWLFYGWDEPGPDNLSALQQYQCWWEGGAKTYVTFYQRATYEVAGHWMSAPCFSAWLVNNKESAEWARRKCDENGQRFLWYGSGCYLGQEGRMFPNRYLTGWLFWKTKADGQVSWTFVRPHEDPFNDFDGVNANSVEPKDQCIVYPYFERPNDYNSLLGLLPTIQWEAMREGINDYKYAYTLKSMIEYAKRVAEGKDSEKARRLRQITEETEKIFTQLEESVPWGNEVDKIGFNNGNLASVRRTMAVLLERLAQALEGNIPSETGKSKRITLRIKILPPQLPPSESLTAVDIPEIMHPPKIDGYLDDECWKEATILDQFGEHQTATPSPKDIATTALLCYDANNLYIAFSCRSPQPVEANAWGRDNDHIWQEESVEIFIATAEEPHRYAHFIINAKGSIYDELVYDTAWNPNIKAATTTGEDGWSCEVMLPFHELPFPLTPAEKGTFRLNLCRNHKPLGGGMSHWTWSTTYGYYHNPSRFGIGSWQKGYVVLRRIEVPCFFGEDKVELVLLNKGKEEKVAEIGGKRLNLPPQEEVRYEMKVPGEVGEHKVTVPISYEGKAMILYLSYSIPKPMKVFAPTLLVENGRITLPIAFNTSPSLSRKLCLGNALGKRQCISLPSRGEVFSTIDLPEGLTHLRLWLASAPNYIEEITVVNL